MILTTILIAAVSTVVGFLSYSQGYHKGYCDYWGKDLARQLEMSPRQWRIANGYEKAPD